MIIFYILLNTCNTITNMLCFVALKMRNFSRQCFGEKVEKIEENILCFEIITVMACYIVNVCVISVS